MWIYMTHLLLLAHCSRVKRTNSLSTTFSSAAALLRRSSAFITSASHHSSSKCYAKKLDESGYDFSFGYDHETLPDETMYILDGTAMLHRAYYSRDSRDNHASCTIGPDLVANIMKKLSYGDDEISQLMEASGLNPFEYDDVTDVPIGCGPLIAMTLTFARFIRDVKPKYVAVVFDAVRT